MPFAECMSRNFTLDFGGYRVTMKKSARSGVTDSESDVLHHHFKEIGRILGRGCEWKKRGGEILSQDEFVELQSAIAKISDRMKERKSAGDITVKLHMLETHSDTTLRDLSMHGLWSEEQIESNRR